MSKHVGLAQIDSVLTDIWHEMKGHYHDTPKQRIQGFII